MIAAILGTGTLGTALARALSRGGVSLALGSRDPRRATALASRLPGPIVVAADHLTAIRAADLVILALDYAHARQLLTDLAEPLRARILIDPTTPWDTEIPATSAAEELSLLVPGTPVIGAWKTTYAAELDAALPGDPHDTFVCGDDPHAKSRVLTLVAATGFRALDAGPLAHARVLEGMCRMMGPMARTLAGATPAWRFVP